MAEASATALASSIFMRNSNSKVLITGSRGTPSMMLRILPAKPNERSVAKERTRDSMTCTINDLISVACPLGRTQCATSPGSAVLPCIAYKYAAVSGTSGSCILQTSIKAPCAVLSNLHFLLKGLIAMTPRKNWQSGHVCYAFLATCAFMTCNKAQVARNA